MCILDGHFNTKIIQSIEIMIYYGGERGSPALPAGPSGSLDGLSGLLGGALDGPSNICNNQTRNKHGPNVFGPKKSFANWHSHREASVAPHILVPPQLVYTILYGTTYICSSVCCVGVGVGGVLLCNIL